MKSFINFLYVKCFREFCIVDKISKNFSEGKQNNNRKTFLGASHCIYLKFLKMYITFRIHKMPVCCNSLLLHLSTKKMKGGGKYIQKARLFCLCTGSGFGKLQPTLCLFRGIAKHQSASNEKLHIKHLKDTKKNFVGSRKGMGN